MCSLDENSYPLDYFELFFDGSLMNTICAETNRYFELCSGADDVSTYSRIQRWTEATVPELYVFLALFLLMPLAKKHNLQDYWKMDSLTYLPVFGSYMARDRFLLLLRFLHFSDNEHADPHDRLAKVRFLLESIKDKIQNIFVPSQKLVIDESLVLLKGRLSFIQYKPSKKRMPKVVADDIQAVKRYDKRDIHGLMTLQEGRMVDTDKGDHRTDKPIKKPEYIMDYKNMRLMDKSDVQIASVECVRKSVKWYKKFFFHLVDVVVIHSFNLFLVNRGRSQL